MRCEVLAIGTELLLGQIVDTNSAWIGEQLAASGIDSYEHRAIGDNQARIVAALRDLLSRSDAVLVCGGLGPTQDDLTRDAIAELMGVPLVRHDELAETIAQMFRARVRDMPQNNLRQADIPEGGEAIPNPIGTAPGLLCELPDGKVVYAVPGVPYEMKQMVTRPRHPRSAAPLGRGRRDRVALAEDVGHVGVGARGDGRAPARRARRAGRQPDDRVPRARHRGSRRARHREGGDRGRSARAGRARGEGAAPDPRRPRVRRRRRDDGVRGARTAARPGLDPRRRGVADRRADRRAHRQRRRRERHVPRHDRVRTRPT